MCRQSTKVNNCTKPFAASQNKECEEDCNAFRPIIAPLPGVCAGLCQSVHLTTNPKLQNSSVHLDLVCNLFLCMLNSKTAHFTAFLPSVNKHSGSEAANAASDQKLSLDSMWQLRTCRACCIFWTAGLCARIWCKATNPSLPNPSRNYCPFSFLFEIASHPSTGSGCAAKYRRAAAAAWTNGANKWKESESQWVGLERSINSTLSAHLWLHFYISSCTQVWCEPSTDPQKVFFMQQSQMWPNVALGEHRKKQVDLHCFDRYKSAMFRVFIFAWPAEFAWLLRQKPWYTSSFSMARPNQRVYFSIPFQYFPVRC